MLELFIYIKPRSYNWLLYRNRIIWIVKSLKCLHIKLEPKDAYHARFLSVGYYLSIYSLMLQVVVLTPKISCGPGLFWASFCAQSSCYNLEHFNVMLLSGHYWKWLGLKLQGNFFFYSILRALVFRREDK